jgi:hypothetical protein
MIDKKEQRLVPRMLFVCTVEKKEQKTVYFQEGRLICTHACFFLL